MIKRRERVKEGKIDKKRGGILEYMGKERGREKIEKNCMDDNRYLHMTRMLFE